MAGTVPQPGTPTRRQKDHVLLCDWPVEWLERYVARNYVDHDPVVSRMKQLQAPFQWRDATDEIRIDQGGEVVMGDAGEFKLKDGLAFPLVTLDGQIVMVSLGGEQIEMSGARVRHDLAGRDLCGRPRHAASHRARSAPSTISSSRRASASA